jgi:hypothetical protein
VEARFSAPVQTGPGAHPASYTMRTGSLPGVESGRGVTLTPHLLLVPRSRNRVELRASVAYEKGDTYLDIFLFLKTFYSIKYVILEMFILSCNSI